MKIENYFTKRPDMGSGSVTKVLLVLAVPAMMSMFFQNLYALVDTMFISWLGADPLAAQALVVPLFYLALSLGKGIQIGTAALISQARGQGKEGKVPFLARAALPLLLLCMLPLTLLLIPELCAGFFGLLGAGGSVLDQIYPYTFWMIMSFPVMAYVMIGECIFMSHGDTFTPMKAMVLGNALNMLLAPLLMFTLGWGIAGAAIATLLGQIIAAFYIRSRLLQAGLITPSIIWEAAMFRRWLEIGKLGFVVALTFLISPLGLAMVNGVLANFGAAAIGAWNIMSRLEMMFMLPLNGMAGALIPFIAFNYGQGNWNRIQQAIRVFLLAAVSFLLPVIAIVVLSAKWLVLPFGSEVEVAELSIRAIRIAALGDILAPLELVLYGTAQGLKRPLYPLIAMGARILIFRYPLAVFFASNWGVYGVYWSQPVAMILSAILSSILLWRLLNDIMGTLNKGNSIVL